MDHRGKFYGCGQNDDNVGVVLMINYERVPMTCCRYRQRENSLLSGGKQMGLMGMSSRNDTISDLIEQSSGSGSGLPLLVKHYFFFNAIVLKLVLYAIKNIGIMVDLSHVISHNGSIQE